MIKPLTQTESEIIIQAMATVIESLKEREAYLERQIEKLTTEDRYERRKASANTRPRNPKTGHFLPAKTGLFVKLDPTKEQVQEAMKRSVKK